MEKQWSFTGKTGKHYNFKVLTKSACLPPTGGIYVLAYAHPRGHMSGFHVNPLAMGAAEDLQGAVTVKTRQHHQRLVQECWNYTLIFPLEETDQRTMMLDDLGSIQCPCD